MPGGRFHRAETDRKPMRATLATVIAIAAGILVLAGILMQPLLDDMLLVLIHLAVTLAAVALLIGIINLISVHWMRVRNKEKRSVYSFVVIAAFLITLLAGILLGPSTTDFNYVITGLQYPIEASLMSLTAVSLAFACLSLIRRKHHSLFVFLFLGSALFFILVSIGLFDGINQPIINSIVGFLASLPIGGVRGLLIGMALGSLVTGIRIMTGVDRPYAG
jgi:MFS family permease